MEIGKASKVRRIHIVEGVADSQVIRRYRPQSFNGSRILTIEDPIEFMHRHKRSIVHQRELHSDTPSFALALRAALRQAPKVILVGEMRDKETIEIALEAAETGHLVLSTLHLRFDSANKAFGASVNQPAG
jgi:Tfp pilus assembly pilus retraction ATPase PilT